MVKTFLILFFSLVVIASVRAQETLPDLIERIKPAVVKIIVYDSKGKQIATGSGFYVSSNKVITNKHVIESAYSIQIQTADNKLIPIAKKSDAENTDLTLLESSVENTKITPLVISRNTPREGEKIVVVGSPLGLSGSISDGLVSSFRVSKREGNLLQITAPISPGSSGSPVVNMSGQVVGVATLNLEGGQNLNFAIPSERIISLWENYITTGIASNIYQSQNSQKRENTEETVRFDGIYASEISDSTEYIRFYRDGAVRSMGLNGKRNDKAGREWLADKELSHTHKGNYTLKDGKISFITRYRKVKAYLSYECNFIGLSLKCNIRSYPSDEEYVRIYIFTTFSQSQ